MNEKFRNLGFYPADILLPEGADMTKWAVVACDQFTSQPEYWQAVEDTVGDAPSTLRLILPEAKLNDPDVDGHIAAINGAMKAYLDQGVFKTLPGSLFYIERTQSDGKVRHGLIGMVDLDQYDFTPGSGALIRATEGTVLSRIPPRVRVRQDAPIELPHVMLLIDDPDRTVIEPLTAGLADRLLPRIHLWEGRCREIGWSLDFLFPDWLTTEMIPHLDRLRVPFTIAHMGMNKGCNAVTSRGFQRLKDLAAHGEGLCWIKLTAPYRISTQPDYQDVVPMAQALLEAAPHRIVWGSDFPHASFTQHNTVQLFNLLERIAPDEALRREILVTNPAVLYGFPPEGT